MCDICVDATKELQVFLKQLQERYPGGTVDGITVSPTHHVSVAVLTAAAMAERAEIEYLQSVAQVDFLDEDVIPRNNSLFSMREGRA